MDGLQNNIELSSSSESSSSTSSGPDFEMQRSQSLENNNNGTMSSQVQVSARTATTLAGTTTNGSGASTRSFRPMTNNINYVDGERSSSLKVQERPPRRMLTRAASGNASTSNAGVRTITILEWFTDLGIVIENERLVCVGNAGTKIGRARRNGVFCICCNQTMDVSEFAAHAGSARPHRPYEDVLVARTDKSLLHCQVAAWKQWRRFI